MVEKEMRLQKLMAWRGVASRRASEELIEQGKVSVNGERARLGMKVDVTRDKVMVGKKIVSEPGDYEKEGALPERMIYIMMNKPTGVVTTASDELGRKTVLDLLQKTTHISDLDSSGRSQEEEIGNTKSQETMFSQAGFDSRSEFSGSLKGTPDNTPLATNKKILSTAQRLVQSSSLDSSSVRSFSTNNSILDESSSTISSALEVPKSPKKSQKVPKSPEKSQKVPNLGRVWAVGRLDQGTSGLLILTNDGELTQKLTHPKFETEKTYIAICGGGEWTAREREVFTTGVRLGRRAEKLTAPAKLKLLERRKDNTRKMEITITEGQNQQVRRMCKAVNHPVVALERMAIGELKLDTRLKRGAWRELTEKEVGLIRG